jgi:hypothetical protein
MLRILNSVHNQSRSLGMRPYRGHNAQHKMPMTDSNSSHPSDLYSVGLWGICAEQPSYFCGASIFAEGGRLADRLKIGKSIRVIRDAFDPLVCLVRLYDAETKVRFHVFDQDARPVVSVDGLSIRELLGTSTVSIAIEQARARLEKKGFILKPWIAFS